MDNIRNKLKEVLSSVLPITVLVLLLNFTALPLENPLLIRFLIGSVLIIIGLTLFLFGVDIGITPVGKLMGSTLAKSNKLWLVIIGGFILGFIVSIAEPDLHILAGQVDLVTSGLIPKFSIILVVSIGIGILLFTGFIRILYNISISVMFTVIYIVIFLLSLFVSPVFLAIAFDASGATTGALTVPFVLALGAGISALKKYSKESEEDSFGLIGIISAGAIIGILLMGAFREVQEISGELAINHSVSLALLSPFIREIRPVSRDILLALSPFLIIFVSFQKISFHLERKTFKGILKGLFYTFIGLVLFMVGVNAGFMEVGNIVGYRLALLENKTILLIFGFTLGFLTILAEPAVHVLTQQIEEVTSGHVRRKLVFLALSAGVGLAVALSLLRILISSIKLWHYLLPGYIIAIIMTHFTPKLFVGIAFDSGGVASGPMTATFILAFAQGAARAVEGANVLVDGFGIIAMVAFTPLITIQTLGLVFKLKLQKQKRGET